MKNTMTIIERFLHRHTFWIYLTVLLVFSFLAIASVLKNSWSNYILTFGRLSMVFSPLIIYSFIRSEWGHYLHHLVRKALWLLTFIAAPIFIFLLRFNLIDFIFHPEQYAYLNEDKAEFATAFIATIIIIILLMEFIILISQYFLNSKIDFEKFDLNRMLLLAGVGLSAFLGCISVLEWLHIDVAHDENILLLGYRFLSFTIQIFLIYLVYYSFFVLNRELLIPHFLKPKGVVYYAAAVAATVLILYPILVAIVGRLPIVDTFEVGIFITEKASIFAEDYASAPFLIMLFSLPVIISNQWFEQHSSIANLQKEKSQTELNLLKQQINPHFFFNTLNNLYALSITQDKQTPEVILQLSELMRYVIYKGKEEWVTLAEEIKYIEDYVQLQQIRLHKKLDYHFDKNIFDDQMLIPPLLFITFVENAFKHGVEPAEKASFLHLSIAATEKELIFSCKNSIENNAVESGGVGLKNLKRRLELRFPQRYDLQLEDKTESYTAVLKISQWQT